jgi:hypothetical protein
MSCFELQSRTSDYLDGALEPELKKRAEAHIQECENCKARSEHFRSIVTALKAHPKVKLPESLKSSPLTSALPKLEIRNRRIRWDRTPWVIRASIEGMGIALIVLLIVVTVPRLRSIYEKSLERRLADFSLADFFGRSDDLDEEVANLPLETAKSDAASSAAKDDFIGEDETAEVDSDSEGEDEIDHESPAGNGKPDIRVGNSEIWRFNLKTDSPEDMRPKVYKILRELNVTSDTPGIGGIKAPGGIQFDLIVNQAIVPQIKTQLQRLLGAAAKAAPHAKTTGAIDAMAQDPFTWYKVKSRRILAQGKARVVIWLSLM